MAVMEWVGAVRQMCVSVTDVFWVSRLRWVTDTWRTNISLSKKCMGTLTLYFVSINVQKKAKRLSLKADFCDNTFGEDFVGGDDVVITCAKLQLWMLNEL